MPSDSYDVPARPANPDSPETPDVPELPEAAYRPLEAGSVMISLRLPSDAQVFINDMPTTSTGSERVYLSKGLEDGKQYRYTVRAEVERAGEKLVESREVVLSTGQREYVAFEFDAAAANVAERPQPEQEHPRTTLKVTAPDDAQISVAGQMSNQTGPLRIFHTTRLAADETWEGYTLTATVVRDGREISQTRTVTLRGGQTQELAFDFPTQTAGLVSQVAR